LIHLNSTNNTYEVEGYMAEDEQNDLVILKVKYNLGIPLKLAQTMVKQGDDVLVIGSPKGLAATITKGIVSNLNTELILIQIDAAISPGSSGGPVFNINGEVIGITVAQLERAQNINFAIPVKTLETLLQFKSSYAISLRKTENLSANQNTGINAPTYKQIVIGTQTWMTENLNTDRFSNGDLIMHASTDEDWINAGYNEKPAWCYCDNNTANGQIYGKLYNWYAVNDPRGLCPMGWHVPSDAEWTILTNSLGGEAVAGGKMKSTSRWFATNTSASNSSGFSGLPGGYRTNDDGGFSTVGNYGYWWSSTESSTTSTPGAWTRYMNYGSGNAYRFSSGKQDGFSVRCLRD
jgi:uncharacterized protein (TIGR02145 family)